MPISFFFFCGNAALDILHFFRCDRRQEQECAPKSFFFANENAIPYADCMCFLSPMLCTVLRSQPNSIVSASCRLPFVMFAAPLLKCSGGGGGGTLRHPGQLCTTSWLQTSQSMQKWLWHTEHSYLELTDVVAPAVITATGARPAVSFAVAWALALSRSSGTGGNGI
jgi:hypothetical protein